MIGERCARVLRELTRASARSFRACADTPLSRKDAEAEAQRVAMTLLSSLPRVRDELAMDVQAALSGDPAALCAEEVILSYPGVQAIASHRIAHELYRLQVPMLPRMLSSSSTTAPAWSWAKPP